MTHYYPFYFSFWLYFLFDVLEESVMKQKINIWKSDMKLFFYIIHFGFIFYMMLYALFIFILINKDLVANKKKY